MWRSRSRTTPSTAKWTCPAWAFVHVFSPHGQLLQRLQHGDWLNGPWGLTLAPSDFGEFSRQLLVGQFGSGEKRRDRSLRPVTGEFAGGQRHEGWGSAH